MRSYLLRRLVVALLSLLGLTLLVFLLAARGQDPAALLAGGGVSNEEVTSQISPEEQLAAARERLGLDRPLPVRYGQWLGQALRGDLGTSVITGADVADEIRTRIGATLRLSVVALVLTVLLAVPLGLAGAAAHRRWPDTALRLVALGGASVPGFFLAYLLIALFAVQLHLLPVAGMAGPSSILLPALALAIGPAALVSRLLRSSLIEVMGEEYMRTAQAKGLAHLSVVKAHGLRNATIPVLTVLGSLLGGLLEGAVIVEVVFAWPGIGQLAYDAIVRGDFPLIQGTVLVAGTMILVVNLLVDLSYSRVDPRVRLGARV